MIVKRLLAALAAFGLIAGAWVIRDRVIDSDSADSGNSSDDGDGDAGDVLYCASELTVVCRSLIEDYDDIEIRIADAGDTVGEFASDATPALWLTFEPYPAMVNTLRVASNLDPIDFTNRPLASSPLSVVVRNDQADALTAACDNPVVLACLADQPQLSPTFAPIDTATGAIGVTAAATSFGGGSIDLSDLQFLVWGRRLANAGATSLSGGTAVQTIQTRPTFAVAIGAQAELAATQRRSFTVLEPDQSTTLQVVLMVPESMSIPDELETSLSIVLMGEEWLPASTDPQGQLDPGVILAVSDIWEDLS